MPIFNYIILFSGIKNYNKIVFEFLVFIIFFINADLFIKQIVS